MSDNDSERFGTIEFSWKDGGTPSLKFNKIAHSGRSELMMVSLICETQYVKSVRAALVPDKKGSSRVSVVAGGVRTNVPGREDWYASMPGRLYCGSDGFHVYTHKLGYGLAHAVFVTKSPGFMMVVTPESLWQELNSTRFTTPILREWIPFIDRKLRECNRLENAHVYGCSCGILTATTTKLDESIIGGLTSGDIIIPRDCPVTAAA